MVRPTFKLEKREGEGERGEREERQRKREREDSMHFNGVFFV